jgi:hypothetical protein
MRLQEAVSEASSEDNMDSPSERADESEGNRPIIKTLPPFSDKTISREL